MSLNKIIIICFLYFSTLYANSQTNTLLNKYDSALDYYRAATVNVTSSFLCKKITKRVVISGFIGFSLGSGQGVIFERGINGKVISVMGSGFGSITYIVINHQKEIKNIENEKYKFYLVN